MASELRTIGARELCLDLLRRWCSGRDFADEILHTGLASSSLGGPDRGLVTELFYGMLRHLTRLDRVIDGLVEVRIDHRTRDVLRLGLYQILQLRMPPHAAVNETVALAGRARGLVNAILRRTLREIDDIEADLAEEPLSVRMSHPEFLVKRWIAQHGTANTEALCAWNNVPAEIIVRANTLRTTREFLLEQDPTAKPHPFHLQSLIVERIPSAWLSDGLCYVQDPSTLSACDLLAPQPGESILDACAAPGGKTAYLAALMNNTGRIAACDMGLKRIDRLMENLMRLGVENAQPIHIDWLGEERAPFEKEMFDRILVDAPCSNTGVLRRRVDARWRLEPADFIRMPVTQLALLDALEPFLKPRGSMVFSTCSLEPEENTGVVEKFIAKHPGFRVSEQRQTLPFRDDVDGAFAARLVKPG